MAEYTLGVISSAFVKTIHVELPNEGVHFAVTKVLREYYLLKLISIFDDEFRAVGSPIYDFGKLLVLNQNKTTLRISNVFAMNPATSAV